MSTSKSKGKGVALEPENPASHVFTLRLSKLESDYATMMEEIEKAIKDMNETEINKEPSLLRKPLTFEGRMYTPKGGTFLVRLVPEGEGKVVTLLFQWSDLYFVGFHIEETEVWYYFSDFNTELLPPQSQLRYNPKDGVGKIKLIFGCNYNNVGGFAVKVGRPAFDRCFIALSKAGELHDNEEGQKVLKAGVLALPMVVISEAIRFDPWRACATKRIGAEVDEVVEVEYTRYFLFWQKMSESIVVNNRWKGIEVADLVKVVRVLLRNKKIKAVKKKWLQPASSSRSSGKKR